MKDEHLLAFGKFLQRERLRAGFGKQKELAQLIGVSDVHLSRVENGDSGIRQDTLEALIQVLSLDPRQAYAAWLQVPAEHLEAAFATPVQDEIANKIGMLAARMQQPEKQLALSIIQNIYDYQAGLQAAHEKTDTRKISALPMDIVRVQTRNDPTTDADN